MDLLGQKSVEMMTFSFLAELLLNKYIVWVVKSLKPSRAGCQVLLVFMEFQISSTYDYGIPTGWVFLCWYSSLSLMYLIFL